MAQRKRVDFKDEDCGIDYHGINTHGNTEDADDEDMTDASELSTWKNLVGTLYRHRGVLWAIISVCISTACSLCVKLLAGKMAATQVLFFRGLSQALFSLPYLLCHRVSLRYPFRKCLLIQSRGFVGTLSGFLIYFAVQSLPVATAKALLYSAPLFTGIFARLCLRDRWSVGTVFFACLIVIAVTLYFQPPFIFDGDDVATRNLPGILGAVVGAVVMAISQITVRFTHILRIDTYVIVFYDGIIVMFSGGVVSVALGKWTNPECGLDRGLIIGMATTGFLEQVSATLALKTEPVLVVSIIRTNDIFFYFTFDLIMFGIVPNAWTIVGVIFSCWKFHWNDSVCESTKEATTPGETQQ